MNELDVDYVNTEEAKDEVVEEKKVEFETETLMSTKRDRQFYKNYGLFCTELKHLYVCITRPKKRIIIFDEDSEIRQPILEFWNKLNVIDVVTDTMMKDQDALTE